MPPAEGSSMLHLLCLQQVRAPDNEFMQAGGFKLAFKCWDSCRCLPLAPPKGMSITAVFQVIKLARLQASRLEM